MVKSRKPGRDAAKLKRIVATESIIKKKPKTPAKPKAAPASSSSSSSSSGIGQEAMRDVAKEFFLENKLSGRDIAKMGRGAYNSGASGVDAVARAGGTGTNPRNAPRDLLRHFLKGTDMPALYNHPIPVWNPDTNTQVIADIPFLLPHHVIHSIGDKWKELKLGPDNCPEIWAEFSKQCSSLGIDPCKAIPLGMHGDGVPFTKKHSLEVLSWNPLGHPAGDRVPFSGISKQFICKCGCLGRHTWDAVLEVFAWSCRALIIGKHPSVGPSGEPVAGALVSLAGQPLQQAVLCQVRGDWPFLKALFSVPAWNNQQMCWMCTAENTGEGPLDFRNVGLTAAWRQGRLTAQQFHQNLAAQGISPSPLFKVPSFRLDHIVLDWLHIVDLGVSQDLVGNLFHELVLQDHLPGNNKKERLTSLWSRIKSFYKEFQVPVRLGELTLEMFEKSNKSPKLRAKGGETRHLIPFCALLTAELAHVSPHWKAVATIFDLLLSCAKIAATAPFDVQGLATTSRKLCVLWRSLATEAEASGDSQGWRLKPKVHLFQELCEYKAGVFGSPEHFWTYADESFCGFMAKVAKRRGGQNNPHTIPERLLQRYRAMRG